MQPIERYGVVALLFVVIAVVTVVAWGDPEAEAAAPSGFLSADAGQAPQTQPARTSPKKWNKTAKAKPPKAAELPLAQREALARPGEIGATVQPLEAPTRAADVLRESAAYDAELRAQAPRESRRSSANAPSRNTSLAQTTAAPKAAESRRAPAQPAAATAGGTRKYTVEKGDTLSEIAQRELGKSSRWKEIVDLNAGLDPRKLRHGTDLILPVGDAATSGSNVARPTESRAAQRSRTESESPKSPAVAGAEYRVQSGDSLWRIAKRALGDGERWREIPPLNPGLDPDRLKAGQVVMLPAGANVAAATSQPKAATRQVAKAEKPRGRVR